MGEKNYRVRYEDEKSNSCRETESDRKKKWNSKKIMALTVSARSERENEKERWSEAR